MLARIRVLLIGTMLGATAAGAQADPATAAPPPADTAFVAAVQRMLAASGARVNMRTVIDGMIDAYKRAMPQVPQAFWEEMRVDFDVDTLIALEIPIYKKYLTVDDILAISAFYETPAGKRLIAAQPFILKESMQVGREWGEAVRRQILEKARSKGYIKSS